MHFWSVSGFASETRLLATQKLPAVGFVLGSSGPISDNLTILNSAHLLSSWGALCPSHQPSPAVLRRAECSAHQNATPHPYRLSHHVT